MKPKTRLSKKLKLIQKLKIKALKNKPIWKPSKGYMYLQDVEIGTVVTIPSCKLEAIKIQTNEGQTTVIVTKCFNDKEGFGKTWWANKTEVKIQKVKS